METGVLTMRVTVTQPALIVNGIVVEEVSQEALIAFGRWYKGDKGEKGEKGDKGDSWETDFDIASNEDIDALFE